MGISPVNVMMKPFKKVHGDNPIPFTWRQDGMQRYEEK